MIDKGATGFAIFSVPIAASRSCFVVQAQELCAEVRERVYHGRGPVRWVVVKLRFGAIHIPCMKKAAEPIVSSVNGASNKLGNMRRSQEPALRD